MYSSNQLSLSTRVRLTSVTLQRSNKVNISVNRITCRKNIESFLEKSVDPSMTQSSGLDKIYDVAKLRAPQILPH
jgi:hypothetical protein